MSSPDYDIDDISSTDNISPIKTFNDLQTFVQQNAKPISIVFFYGRYCPYSKRTIPGLRQWARINQDRIFLYEADIEQASKLAEYYHVRTVPTIMAFEDNNLLAPIWQRTANNVLSSIDESEPINDNKEISIDHHNQIEEIFREKLDNSNNIFLILDPSLKGSNRLLKKIVTQNENYQEQYLILLDNNQSISNKSKLIFGITSKIYKLTNIVFKFIFLDEKDQTEFLKTIEQSNDWNSKSISSSEQSPYIWNRSIPNIENNSQKSQSTIEYNGRMISQSVLSTMSNDDQWKSKFLRTRHALNPNVPVRSFSVN